MIGFLNFVVVASDKPAERCGEVESYKLTDDEQQEILKFHNDIRAKVASGNETRGAGSEPVGQPPGIIPPLTWDDSIAAIAQRWANQCNETIDQCRNTETAEASQSIAVVGTYYDLNFTMTEIMEMWYNEIDIFSPDDIGSYNDDMGTADYTQIIWEKTTNIGCGITRYNPHDQNITFLVCNYSPPGNIPGKPIYTIIKTDE